MSGSTPIKSQQAWPTTNDGVTILNGDGEANGVLTISTGDGEVLTYVRPNRMDSLPNDVIQAIFIRLVTTRNFSVFSETCVRMYRISCNIPVYAFPSGSLLSDSGFLHNMEFKRAATQLIQTTDMEPWASLHKPSLELQNVLNTFYTTFTRCCIQLDTKIDCREFFNNYESATKKVSKIYLKTHPGMYNQVRMLNVYLRLHERVYGDIINITTDRLNESITFHTFKSSAAQIKGLFDEKNVIDIEADLRNALRTKYDTTFQAYASQCLNAFPTSTIVAEMEQQLKAPLEAEKAAIEAEIAILRGPSFSNGTVNDAYLEMQALMNMPDEPPTADRARMESARIAYRNAFQEEFKYEGTSSLRTLHSLCFERSNEIRLSYEGRYAIVQVLDIFLSPSVSKRLVAKAKFEELVARLDTLAQWEKDTDTLIGGKLFEVCNKLANTGFISLYKVRQRGQFYAELACPVTEGNKEERYNSLLKFSNT